jgi:hypothetical protein
MAKEKLKTSYSTTLRTEVAEKVPEAMRPGETAGSFAAMAIAYFVVKRTTGKWPKKLPEDLQPRKAGRRWPKSDE